MQYLALNECQKSKMISNLQQLKKLTQNISTKKMKL
jgi:hypothetical protein